MILLPIITGGMVSESGFCPKNHICIWLSNGLSEKSRCNKYHQSRILPWCAPGPNDHQHVLHFIGGRWSSLHGWVSWSMALGLWHDSYHHGCLRTSYNCWSLDTTNQVWTCRYVSSILGWTQASFGRTYLVGISLLLCYWTRCCQLCVTRRWTVYDPSAIPVGVDLGQLG